MKTYKPTTPSRRFITNADYSILTKKGPEKSLAFGFKRDKGRSGGKITMRHIGGGAKKLYRQVDFLLEKKDISGEVQSVEYDPNRSGFIGLVRYPDGNTRYLLLPEGIKAGDKIIASENAPISPGNRLPLAKMPVGSLVYNLEIKPGSGAKLVRSAGNFAEVLALEGKYALIKLPSREIRKIESSAFASIGKVSNPEHIFASIGKAGRTRLLGIRPTVRAKAMNPKDHPYGGGEGRTPRGTRRPKTKWGKVTGGRKTRKRKKYSDIFIIQRRVKK